MVSAPALAKAGAVLHPDTMGQRYGAYAQLLGLFRMVRSVFPGE